MSIGVWGYLEEYATEREEVLAAIERVLESGQLILGPEVKAFEEEFSATLGVAHTVGVANGTDALTLALRALEIGAGDEVLTVANTAVPTISAIVAAGAIPRFVDIDPHTYLMDLDAVEAASSEQIRCVLPVHLYGQCVNMTRLSEIAHRRGWKILEDCAQAHGAQHAGRLAGSFGDAAAFSFYPTKILGTYGDGGCVSTPHATVATKLRRLRFYGMETTYYSIEDGVNSRLDEIHAAILRGKLKKLENYVTARRLIATRYNEALEETSLVLPKVGENNFHAYYLYVVRHPEREALLAKLAEQGIHLNVSYRWPIHSMPPFKQYLREGQTLPHTEHAAEQIFSLPMYPSLPLSAIDKILTTLGSII